MPPPARCPPHTPLATSPLPDPSLSPTAEEPRETDLLRGAAGQACGRVRGWALTARQLRALFTKRMLHARRSTRGFFAQVWAAGRGWGRARGGVGQSRP